MSTVKEFKFKRKILFLATTLIMFYLHIVAAKMCSNQAASFCREIRQNFDGINPLERKFKHCMEKPFVMLINTPERYHS